MEKYVTSSVTKLVGVAEEGVKTVEKTVGTVEKTVETVAAPARESLLKRFPVVFTLLVTFGISTTFLGLEQLVLQIPFLSEHPLLMLGVGVGVLSLTGTLYKKLG